MIILTIRSDNLWAEIGLFADSVKLAYKKWQADRQLAETIHSTIRELLKSQKLDWHEIEGIIGYSGPGSFTGLRIGLTVGNSLAHGLEVSIVAARGEDWVKAGLARLLAGDNDGQVLPEYGAPVHITAQKR